MAQQFFGGTIQTLSNLIQQEKQQRFLKQSPQYQQALFNLMQAKEQAARLGTFREQIAQGQLTPSQIAQQGVTFAAGEGQLDPALNIAGQEATTQRIPIASKEQRKAAVPGVVETFETGPDGLTSEDINYWVEKGTLPEEAYPRLRVRPRQFGSLDPFTRAYQGGLGRAAAEAETKTLPAVGAIVNDMETLFDFFDAIDEQYKGPAAGRTLGFAAKAYDTNVQTYEATRQLNLSNILKGIAQEVGVLTDTDIRRVKMAQPELWDTPETVRNKKAFLYNYIDSRVRGAQKNARRPVTGINIPEGLRIKNFDINKKQPWEAGGIPAKGQQKVPTLPRTGQTQPPAQQAAPQQQGDEIDARLNSLGL